MTQATAPSGGQKQRLGEMLLREGVITSEQLQRALDEQRAYGGRLGRHLVDLGFLSEPVLLEALARQLHVARIDLDAPGATAADAARYARADLADQWGFCPVSFDRKRNVLVIAVSDPDPQLLADIEGFLALRVEPRLASADAIERAVHRLYFSATEPVRRLAGLQVARSQARQEQQQSRRQDELGPATAPSASEPPAPTPFDAHLAQQVAMQQQLQMHLQQLQLQAQRAAAVQAAPFGGPLPPPLGYSAPPFPPPAYPGYYPPAELTLPPGARPPPAAPARPSMPPPSRAPAPMLPDVSASGPSLGELQDQLARLERTLAAQARALRSLVEVLVDRGLLTKAEMARKQQELGK